MTGQVGTTEVEIVADWPWALAAHLDSLGRERYDEDVLQTLVYGAWEASHRLRPSARRTLIPSVTQVAFDEVPLPRTALSPEALAALTGPQARVVGLGVERKRLAATLGVRLLSYDEGRQVLRRYRRVVVQVREGQAPVTQVAKGQAFTNPHLAVSTSVLAEGAVFKIPVTEAGIYRIDRGLLAALGLTPDTIDPNTVKVYGNGGEPVPALNSAPRLADLAENATVVQGGGDGRFDGNDAVYFYAQGPTGWHWDADENEWQHYVHPFSNQNYYFLKVDATPGAHLQPEAFPGFTDATTQEVIVGRHFVDFDDFNWSKEHGSGLTWYSNPIRVGGSVPILQGERLPGQVGGTVTYEMAVAIQSNPRATVRFTAGGTQYDLRATQSISRSAEAASAAVSLGSFTQTVADGASLDLSMELLSQINDPQAAVDWVEVFYPQRLTPTDGHVFFHTPGGSDGRYTFVLQGFSQQPQVWDVTEPENLRQLGVQPQGSTYRVQVAVAAGDAPRELVAFVPSSARSLDSDAILPVAPQNLHGLDVFPDLVIVTPSAFRDQAERLAEHRRQQGLVVVVSDVGTIFNEFSGGVPDMRAFRDYFKFLYDRGTAEANTLRYALMFGDGHFNFRNLGVSTPPLDNWVFPYATENSLHPDRSFTSDDYFGLLDDNEGVWAYAGYSQTTFERVDIGVGRLPVQTVEEAQMMVDKLIRYDDPATYGPWRARYLFAADDGPTGLSGSQNDADLHLQNVDQVAELVRNSLFPEVNVKKLYAESFQRVFQNGFRIPKAKEAINDAINSGALLFNYSGHGGPNGLAQEDIFTKSDAEALRNGYKLPVFVTATCSFGWWDIDNEQSGAEALLLNPDGGAIAMLTTVRIVYTSGSNTSLNAGLNRAMNIELFTTDDSGLPQRIGDAFRETKNTTVGLQGNSRKFNLLGDPTMRLGVPTRQTRINTVNGAALATEAGQLQALDRVTLTGDVLDGSGQVDTGFDGTVTISVFDAVRQIDLVERRYMPTTYYNIREDLIWRGQVAANDGAFAATFVVPKDISYSNQAGRISAYASGTSRQALGFTENVLVGGTSSNPPNDAVGPEIRLFLNDSTFVSGGLIAPEAELIVKLFDESGINTVGAGVGHEMLLIIDGNEAEAEEISDGFTSAPNSFQEGEVRWSLPALEPGPHTLTVRAWDVLNNSQSATLAFTITESQDLTIQRVFNFPNPMTSATRFVFEHNQPPGTEARVQVRIYTLNGTPVRTIDPEEALPGGILPAGPVQVFWDGLDQDRDRLASGVYLYKLRVQVTQPDGARQVAEQIEKLALIR